MSEEESTVMRLMNALITKMERMDMEMGEMRQQMRNPDAILKRAGFVRAQSPSVNDVWGDPLRGDRSGVIAKAGDGTEIDVVGMPSSNEEWQDGSIYPSMVDIEGGPYRIH